MKCGCPVRSDLRSPVRLAVFLLVMGTGSGLAGPLDGLRPVFDHLTVDQGLPENTVRAILQDRQGFLWFGTQNGLARYDGYDMIDHWHDAGDSTAAPRFFVTSLYEDGRGNLWIGTLLNGIWRLDPRTERCELVLPAPGPPETGRAQHVPCVCEDRDGRIWVSWPAHGLCRIDLRDGSVAWFRHDPDDPTSLPTDRLGPLICDRQGRLWVGTEGEGVVVHDVEDGTFTVFRHDPRDGDNLLGPHVTGLLEAPDGRIWISSFRGLSCWLPQRRALRNLVPDPAGTLEMANYLMQAVPDGDGGLWIGSAVGLYHYATETDSFTLFAHDPADPRSPVKGPILSVCRDRSGIVWAGSWHAGLNKLDPTAQKFTYVGHDPDDPGSLDDDAVMSVCEDASGTLWVGTGSMSTGGSSGALNHLDAATGRFVHHRFPLTGQVPVRTVESLAEDRDGRLWLGTNAGLWRLDRTSGVPVRAHADSTPEAGISDVPVRSLLVDQAGDVWVGTFRSGIYHISRDGRRIRRYLADPDDPHSLSQDLVIVMYQDGDGRIWVGTDSRGLNLYRPATDDFQSWFDPRLGLTSLIDIFEDSRGRLWLGTYAGLLEFDPERGGVVRTVSVSEGLPHGVVAAILEDGRGGLWLSTGRGLCRFDPETGAVRSYDTRDGLPANELFFGHERRRDGTLVFGGHHGLVRYDPEQIRQNPYVPPVVVTELRLGGRAIPASDLPVAAPYLADLSLPHDRNHLGFTFAALHFSHPDRNRYRYRLHPFEADWREADNRRTASYTNLDPGHYVFEVQGASGDGVWNEAGVHVAVEILPPWWDTIWARLLYLLLATGLVWLIYRQVVNRERMRAALEVERAESRKLQELDDLKSRFFANITHEFRTPLTLLQAPLQRLQNAPQGGDEQLFAMMSRNAGRLGQLIDQLLDLSRLDARRLPLRWAEGDCVGTLRTIAAAFSSLAESRSLRFETDLPDAPLPCWYDADLLEKVAGNLLSNAFKFTPDGERVLLEVAVGTESGPVVVPEVGGPAAAARTALARTLTLRVVNSGSYIPPGGLERIFDRFHQLAGGQSAGGSGIGLALVRELVEWQGGRIRVQSDRDTGTRFTIELPVFLEPPVAGGAAGPDAGDAEPAGPGDGSELVSSEDAQDRDDARPLVLIVEDSPDLRGYLGRELRETYRVLLAATGDEGLELACQEIPDVVISDVMMPGLDGFALCRRLREDERTCHVPIILLTALAEAESRRTGFREGADAYLPKPFDSEELRIRIAALITQRRRLAEVFAHRVIQLPPEAMPVTSADERFLQRVRKIVENHLDDEDLQIEDLCREAGLSRAQLHRKLKALTGQSAGEFVRAHRLQRAADLLKGGYGNVTEVAYAVGFRSLSHFAKCFRQQYDAAPSEFLPRG